MSEPSVYEMNTWNELRSPGGHWWDQPRVAAGNALATGVERAKGFVSEHPRLESTVVGAVEMTKKGQAAAAQVVPGWVGATAGAVTRTLAGVARVGLSPEGVVAKHRKRGHEVEFLADVRRLDLKQVDIVRGRPTARKILYSLVGGGAGAGSAFVISGSQLALVPTAGASAAPSVGAIAGAVGADATAMTALLTRVVGEVALGYGYDPTLPGESLFVQAAMRLGNVMNATAKEAALRELSFITQKLVRNQTWAVLKESVLVRLAKDFADQYAVNLTKKGLGKLVPIAGIGIATVLNVDSVLRTIEAAEFAYRRRFLLEKYPQLATAQDEADAPEELWELGDRLPDPDA